MLRAVRRGVSSPSGSVHNHVRQREGKGPHLLDLVEDPVALRTNLRRPDFVYVPESLAHISTVSEVGESTRAPSAAGKDSETDD